MPKIFISDLLEILEKGFFREKLSFVEKNVYQFLTILARIYPEYIQNISRNILNEYLEKFLFYSTKLDNLSYVYKIFQIVSLFSI